MGAPPCTLQNSRGLNIYGMLLVLFGLFEDQNGLWNCSTNERPQIRFVTETNSQVPSSDITTSVRHDQIHFSSTHISCLYPHDIPMDIPMCLDLHPFLNPGWFSGFRLLSRDSLYPSSGSDGSKSQLRSEKEGVHWNCYSETMVDICG